MIMASLILLKKSALPSKITKGVTLLITLKILTIVSVPFFLVHPVYKLMKNNKQ